MQNPFLPYSQFIWAIKTLSAGRFSKILQVLLGQTKIKTSISYRPPHKNVLRKTIIRGKCLNLTLSLRCLIRVLIRSFTAIDTCSTICDWYFLHVYLFINILFLQIRATTTTWEENCLLLLLISGHHTQDGHMPINQATKKTRQI